MLAQEQGLSILPESVKEYQVPLNKEENQISLANTKSIIDTFVLLANSEKLLKKMADLNMDEIISAVNTLKNEDLMN